MRIPPEGKPFVPPNPVCPAGQEGTIPDISAVTFRLSLDPHPGQEEPAGVWGAFNTVDELGDQKDLVQTDVWELPPDSPTIRRLYDLLPTRGDRLAYQLVGHTGSPFVEKVRRRFCERIADCQGIVNGECWALGATAVQEVIEETLRPIN